MYTHLGTYSTNNSHSQEIEYLFGLLIITHNSDHSNLVQPYDSLYKFELTRSKLRNKVTVDICKYLGSPLPDTLKICITGGILCLKNYLDALEHVIEIDENENLVINNSKLSGHLDSSIGERFIFHSL